MKYLNSIEIARQILAESQTYQFSIANTQLLLSQPRSDIGLIFVRPLFKYFLTFRGYLLIDDHHIQYISDNFPALYTQIVNLPPPNKTLSNGYSADLNFTPPCILPLLDGSDFILTSAFGHALRSSAPVSIINHLLKDSKHDSPIIDISRHSRHQDVLQSPISFLSTSHAFQDYITQSNTLDYSITPDISFYTLSNLKILCWHPNHSPSEGMRLLCHHSNQRRIDKLPHRIYDIFNYPIIPILSRRQQRVKRWNNIEPLLSRNPYLYTLIIPESYTPLDLADYLDTCGPIVLAAPGSASYVPLCLSKYNKIVVMPLAGNPAFSLDDYYKDFSAYSNVIFIWEDSNQYWSWDKEFSISPKLIEDSIRTIYNSLKFSHASQDKLFI